MYYNLLSVTLSPPPIFTSINLQVLKFFRTSSLTINLLTTIFLIKLIKYLPNPFTYFSKKVNSTPYFF